MDEVKEVGLAERQISEIGWKEFQRDDDFYDLLNDTHLGAIKAFGIEEGRPVETSGVDVTDVVEEIWRNGFEFALQKITVSWGIHVDEPQGAEQAT